MLQELVSKAAPVMCAFNQPRDVGHDKGAKFLDPYDPQVRHECRERIVRDFGLRGTDAGNQRRFADIRKSDQADVGNEFQTQRQFELFALLRPVRRAEALDMSKWQTGRCLPPAASTWLKNAIPGLREIMQQFGSGSLNASVKRNSNNYIFAVFAMSDYLLLRGGPAAL